MKQVLAGRPRTDAAAEHGDPAGEPGPLSDGVRGADHRHRRRTLRTAGERRHARTRSAPRLARARTPEDPRRARSGTPTRARRTRRAPAPVRTARARAREP